MPDADFPRRRFHGSGDFSARRCAEVSRLGAVGRLQEQWCNVGVSANGAMMTYIGASCGESPARSGEWSVTVDDVRPEVGIWLPLQPVRPGGGVESGDVLAGTAGTVESR